MRFEARILFERTGDRVADLVREFPNGCRLFGTYTQRVLRSTPGIFRDPSPRGREGGRRFRYSLPVSVDGLLSHDTVSERSTRRGSPVVRIVAPQGNRSSVLLCCFLLSLGVLVVVLPPLVV